MIRGAAVAETKQENQTLDPLLAPPPAHKKSAAGRPEQTAKKGIPYQAYTILYTTILHAHTCYTILYYTSGYYTVLYTMYYTLLYYNVLYVCLCSYAYYTTLTRPYAILYCAILYYTALYCTILYCTILYYTKLYDTILYYMNWGIWGKRRARGHGTLHHPGLCRKAAPR